jgi:hypothetical protein
MKKFEFYNEFVLIKKRRLRQAKILKVVNDLEKTPNRRLNKIKQL